MNHAFFIPCLPPAGTAQQKGVMVINGKPRFFKKKKMQEQENTLLSLLTPYAPTSPMEGPLSLGISFIYPWRKTEKKGVIAQYSMFPIQTRPDCSNLIKAIEDVMTTLRFWNDDSQVAILKVEKFYGDRPGIGINLVRCHAFDKRGGFTDCIAHLKL